MAEPCESEPHQYAEGLADVGKPEPGQVTYTRSCRCGTTRIEVFDLTLGVRVSRRYWYPEVAADG